MLNVIRKSIAQLVYHRLNSDVDRLQNEFEQTEFYSREQIEQYQFSKLKKILLYSINVPYYRELYQNYDIRIDDIKSLDDIKRIPILTKDIIRKHGERMFSGAKYKYKVVKTSGSTGEPITIAKDRLSRNVEMALVRRFEKQIGVDIGDRTLLIWGGLEMSRIGQLKRKCKQLLYNTDMFNNYNINPDNIDNVIKIICKHQYRYLRGYSTSVALIAQAICNRDYQSLLIPKPEAISVSVEKLLSSDRIVIEKVFGKVLYDQYGCGEVNSIAFECSDHMGMHHNFEHSFIEVLDDRGRDCGSGKLIITNLDNNVFPLIRYENGDRVTLSKKCCSCGRSSALISSIDGRSFDYIKGTNGSVVHGGFFDDLILESNADVQQIQFTQEEINRISVVYVSTNSMSNSVIEYIRGNIQKHLGSDMIINVKKVEIIDLEDNGKRKLVRRAII